LRVSAMPYAELQVTTNYSFLRSGSHPGEFVEQAVALGHNAIGIADRNTLAGVVRAFIGVKEYYEEEAEKGRLVPVEKWIKLLVGARLETLDGYSLLAYPMSLDGYKRLSRMLSEGNLVTPQGKSECKLTFAHLETYANDILAIVLPPRQVDDPAFRDKLGKLAKLFSGRCYLAATMLFRGNDSERLADLDNLAGCGMSQRRIAIAGTISRGSSGWTGWRGGTGSGCWRPTTFIITRPSEGRCMTSSRPSASNAQSPNWASVALPPRNAI